MYGRVRMSVLCDCGYYEGVIFFFLSEVVLEGRIGRSIGWFLSRRLGKRRLKKFGDVFLLGRSRGKRIEWEIG